MNAYMNVMSGRQDQDDSSHRQLDGSSRSSSSSISSTLSTSSRSTSRSTSTSTGTIRTVQRLNTELESKDTEINLLVKELAGTREALAASEALCKQLKEKLEFERNNSMAATHAKVVQIDLSLEILITTEDILFFGLCHVGFGEERQQVREKLCVSRFIAHFGVEPRTVKDLLLELKEKFTALVFKQVMMALNWLKMCKSLLAGCIFFLFLFELCLLKGIDNLQLNHR